MLLHDLTDAKLVCPYCGGYQWFNALFQPYSAIALDTDPAERYHAEGIKLYARCRNCNEESICFLTLYSATEEIRLALQVHKPTGELT